VERLLFLVAVGSGARRPASAGPGNRS